MTQASDETKARSRKTETQLRNRLAEVSQKRVADIAGKDESAVSRWKDMQLEPAALYITALGFKLVPLDLITADEVKAMRTLAMRGLQHMEQGAE